MSGTGSSRPNTASQKRNLPTLFRRYGNLVSFEISPMKDNATKVFAFARFSNLVESSTAIEELRNKKVEALNNSPIYLEIISSIKYYVRYELWLVLEPEVKQPLNTCNEGRTDVRNTVKFALFERKNMHDYIQKLRIYSKDLKSLGRTKMAIDKIVKDDIIKSGDDVLWDRDFESPAGQEKLASFAIPGRCELVWIVHYKRSHCMAKRPDDKQQNHPSWSTFELSNRIARYSKFRVVSDWLHCFRAGCVPFIQGLEKTVGSV